MSQIQACLGLTMKIAPSQLPWPIGKSEPEVPQQVLVMGVVQVVGFRQEHP